MHRIATSFFLEEVSKLVLISNSTLCFRENLCWGNVNFDPFGPAFICSDTLVLAWWALPSKLFLSELGGSLEMIWPRAQSTALVYLVYLLYHTPFPEVVTYYYQNGSPFWCQQLYQKMFTTMLSFLGNKSSSIFLEKLKTALMFFPFFLEPSSFLGEMSSIPYLDCFFSQISAWRLHVFMSFLKFTRNYKRILVWKKKGLSAPLFWVLYFWSCNLRLH